MSFEFEFEFEFEQGELKSYPPPTKVRLRNYFETKFRIRNDEISYTKCPRETKFRIRNFVPGQIRPLETKFRLNSVLRMNFQRNFARRKDEISSFRIRKDGISYTKCNETKFRIYEWKFRMTKFGEDEFCPVAIFWQ